MHELSICQALLTQVAEIAKGRGAAAVERIVIGVGPLSGVEPQLLARAFEVARTGSCAQHAVLSIEATSVTVSCKSCGAITEAASNRLICGACGGYRNRIVSGDELTLCRVELQMPESPASAAA